MQISSNINFRASHISTRQIQKLNPVTKKFEKCEANFVELDSKKDVAALRFIDKHWRAQYASNIFAEAKNKLTGEYNSYDNNDHSRFFALTLQKDSYEDLLPKEILGVAEITDDFWQAMYNFDYLQVKPAYKYQKNKDRCITGVGSTISDEIKKIYKGRPIKLVAAPDAVEFWKKQGYEVVSTICGGTIMVLQRSK